MSRIEIDVPAAKLQHNGIWLDALGNLASTVLQNLNLSIGEVILVEVRDLLKQLETSFIVE